MPRARNSGKRKIGDRHPSNKYCKCKGGLILANLETGKGECPICKLPKKLSPRLKRMSKIYQDKTPKQKGVRR